ncbi:hypothetical protein Tco_1469258, partial [Tanacetum coccineum]
SEQNPNKGKNRSRDAYQKEEAANTDIGSLVRRLQGYNFAKIRQRFVRQRRLGLLNYMLMLPRVFKHGKPTSYSKDVVRHSLTPKEVLQRASALRNFDLEVMELENTHNNALAKLPMLKLEEYEMWEIKIKQYFQIQDYALWEVIENGNSWVPIP